MVHIVANRLPVTVSQGRVISSDGGLVRLWKSCAVSDARQWFGIVSEPITARAGMPLSCSPLLVDKKMYQAYYDEFCNSTLWPLFHGLDHLVQKPTTMSWESYYQVNGLMSQHIARSLPQHETIVINDYHFLWLPEMLANLRPDLTIIFYLHIPWPDVASFQSLPQSTVLLRAMLSADVIGVQTALVKQAMVRSCERLKDDVFKADILKQVNKIKVAPVASDWLYFKERSRHLMKSQPSLKLDKGFVFFGVDRLDPIKGLIEKVDAFHCLLNDNSQLIGKVQLRQFIIPSRESIPYYSRYKARLFQLIDQVNSRFQTDDWKPIDVHYRQLTDNELIAHYLSSHALIVSSVCDGMNLVAFEYLSSQDHDNPGVLCLSNKTGASNYLKGALLFNPTNVKDCLQVLLSAITMPLSKRRQTHDALMQVIESYTVNDWRNQLIDLEYEGSFYAEYS